MAIVLRDLTNEFEDKWLENLGSMYAVDRRWRWWVVVADSTSCLGFCLVCVGEPPHINVVKYQCVQGAKADILRSWKNEHHNGWQKGEEVPLGHHLTNEILT